MAARERLCDYFAVVGPKEADLENRVVQEAYSIGSLHRYVMGGETRSSQLLVSSSKVIYVC
jgi:hypothetical protein